MIPTISISRDAVKIKKGEILSVIDAPFIEHYGIAYSHNRVFKWSRKRNQFEIIPINEFFCYSPTLKVYKYANAQTLTWNETKQLCKYLIRHNHELNHSRLNGLLNRNCEWTVSFVKTGKGYSGQIEFASKIIIILVTIILFEILGIDFTYAISSILVSLQLSREKNRPHTPVLVKIYRLYY